VIPLLDLDDITYQELVQDALASLPKLCPSWTDFNASDPGIALIEMLAWLAEMIVYRTNQITPANQWNFLQLLRGPGWTPDEQDPDPQTALQAAIYETVTMLRTPDRAVTTSDYVWLVENGYPSCATYPDAAAQIGRVRCLGETALGWTPSSSSSSSSSLSSSPGPSLDAAPRLFSSSGAQLDAGSSTSGTLYTLGSCTPPTQKGHVSVVILPSALTQPNLPSFGSSSSSSSLSSASSVASSASSVASSASSEAPASSMSSTSSSSSGASTPWVPPQALLDDINAYLYQKRMLTTQLHVVAPRVAFLQVTAGLFLYPNASGQGVLAAAVAQLVGELDPLRGGQDKTGWPFDRDLYPSDLYSLLQRVVGVNFVYVDSDVSRIGSVTPPSALTLSIIGTAGPVTCPPGGSVPLVDMSCFDVMWLTPDNCRLSIYEPVGTPIGQQYIQTYSNA
jgi:hypothetical protein